jgi:hypothetical protein
VNHVIRYTVMLHLFSYCQISSYSGRYIPFLFVRRYAAVISMLRKGIASKTVCTQICYLMSLTITQIDIDCDSAVIYGIAAGLEHIRLCFIYSIYMVIVFHYSWAKVMVRKQERKRVNCRDTRLISIGNCFALSA